MSDVIQRVADCKCRKILHISNDLDSKSAGSNSNIVRSFRDDSFELLLCQKLVAQEINFFDACDVLALFFGKCSEIITICFFYGLKFLETFVTSDNKEIVFSFKKGRKFFVIFQYILGIIHPFISFPISFALAIFMPYFFASPHTKEK